MTNSEQRRLTHWRLRLLRTAKEAGNVAWTCRHFGISRKSFYKWRQRYLQHGDAGLADRARAPHRRPRTPHLNGKVERSHRVDDQEFYQLLDKDGITDDIHLFNDKLREWRTIAITTGRTGHWTDKPHTSGFGKNESRNVTGVLRTYTLGLRGIRGLDRLRSSLGSQPCPQGACGHPSQLLLSWIVVAERNLPIWRATDRGAQARVSNEGLNVGFGRDAAN